MKRVYFLIQEWDHPASRYRVLQYLPCLKESQIEAKVALFPNSFYAWMKLFSELKDYHIVFVQKKRLWRWQLWYLRRKHIRIIYDFDDAIMFKSPVDGGGRSFKRQRTFARMVRYSDQIIAGNQYLKSQALPYNKNIIVLPTSVDTSRYNIKDYSLAKDRVTIGWIGSKSSLPFLKKLIPVFDHLAYQYAHIELKIICNDFFDCNKMPVVKKMWSLEDENSDLQDIDIGLSPLPDHEWTKGKCATKLLQYLSAGIPVVCSPVGVHNEIIKEGINGMFATSKEEWIEKINRLIKDNNLRKCMGLEGRKTVELFYSLKTNGPKFVKAIEGFNIMTDNLPLVSIILPTYNCADFLPYSVGSILSQTYNAYEIIIIDDGSTDRTREVLNPFMQKIRYIRLEKNMGLPTARNTGIQLARGRYVAFIDADDIWQPEKLQANVEYLETHPDVGMVYSRHINIDGKGNILGGISRRHLPSGHIFTKLFSEQNFIITSSVVVLKDVFKKTGLFDEGLFNCQDWDMYLRIAYHFKIAGINKPLVKYRHNPRSLSKNRNNVLKYQKLVIDKTYSEFKGKNNGITEKLYKKRLAMHYAKVGRYYLRTGDKGQASENFRLALRYDPLNFRTIRYFLMHIL